MARPEIPDLFGFGSGHIDAATTVQEDGVFIPYSAMFPEGGWPGNIPPDGQQYFLALCQQAFTTLNESNRNNDRQSILVTGTYGEYDSIIDPPGSNEVYRRDVFSIVVYQPQQYENFDIFDV